MRQGAALPRPHPPHGIHVGVQARAGGPVPLPLPPPRRRTGVAAAAERGGGAEGEQPHQLLGAVRRGRDGGGGGGRDGAAAAVPVPRAAAARRPSDRSGRSSATANSRSSGRPDGAAADRPAPESVATVTAAVSFSGSFDPGSMHVLSSSICSDSGRILVGSRPIEVHADASGAIRCIARGDDSPGGSSPRRGPGGGISGDDAGGLRLTATWVEPPGWDKGDGEGGPADGGRRRPSGESLADRGDGDDDGEDEDEDEDAGGGEGPDRPRPARSHPPHLTVTLPDRPPSGVTSPALQSPTPEPSPCPSRNSLPSVDATESSSLHTETGAVGGAPILKPLHLSAEGYSLRMRATREAHTERPHPRPSEGPQDDEGRAGSEQTSETECWEPPTTGVAPSGRPGTPPRPARPRRPSPPTPRGSPGTPPGILPDIVELNVALLVEQDMVSDVDGDCGGVIVSPDGNPRHTLSQPERGVAHLVLFRDKLGGLAGGRVVELPVRRRRAKKRGGGGGVPGPGPDAPAAAMSVRSGDTAGAAGQPGDPAEGGGGGGRVEDDVDDGGGPPHLMPVLSYRSISSAGGRDESGFHKSPRALRKLEPPGPIVELDEDATIRIRVEVSDNDTGEELELWRRSQEWERCDGPDRLQLLQQSFPSRRTLQTSGAVVDGESAAAARLADDRSIVARPEEDDGSIMALPANGAARGEGDGDGDGAGVERETGAVSPVVPPPEGYGGLRRLRRVDEAEAEILPAPKAFCTTWGDVTDFLHTLARAVNHCDDGGDYVHDDEDSLATTIDTVYSNLIY